MAGGQPLPGGIGGNGAGGFGGGSGGQGGAGFGIPLINQIPPQVQHQLGRLEVLVRLLKSQVDNLNAIVQAGSSAGGLSSLTQEQFNLYQDFINTLQISNVIGGLVGARIYFGGTTAALEDREGTPINSGDIENGDFALTTDDTDVLWFRYGGAWVRLYPKFFTASAPTGITLVDGDRYYDSTAGIMYTRLGGAWVRENKHFTSASPAGVTLQNGDRYQNGATNPAFYRSNGSWFGFTHLA